MLDCEVGASASTVGEGVGGYWRYEKWLRARESEIDSMLGTTGAIYAMRRACWQPLPDGTILDDVLAPMRAVLAGWRVVFEPRALAFDVTAPDVAAESRRKRRTLAGNYQVLALEPRLLVPGLNRVWLQYMSHKLGRLAVPWALIVLLLAGMTLAWSSAVYLLATAIQLGVLHAGGVRRIPRAPQHAHGRGACNDCRDANGKLSMSERRRRALVTGRAAGVQGAARRARKMRS